MAIRFLAEVTRPDRFALLLRYLIAPAVFAVGAIIYGSIRKRRGDKPLTRWGKRQEEASRALEAKKREEREKAELMEEIERQAHWM